MFTLGPLGFTAPALLIGLLALPILWLILRAVPPAPVRRRFPGVALLLGLADRETEADRTPWWLLLLRMLAVAAAIVAFAGPVLNPRTAEDGQGPLLVLFDGSWAGARDWARRIERAEAALDAAARAGRPVALAVLSDPAQGAPVFQAAAAQAVRLPGLRPRAWEPDAAAMADFAAALPEGRFDTLWLSDGLDRPGRADLLAALAARGAVTAVESPRAVLALAAPDFAGAEVRVAARRAPAAGAAEADVSAWGLDPAGIERELARATVRFDDGAGAAEAVFDLPPELRNRITRFQIAGEATAGAVALADDALKRRKVAVVSATADREGLLLLSPTYYVTRALDGRADVIEGQLLDLLPADPDVIVLADVAQLAAAEAEPLLDWVREGGLLLRFAGPRLAAAEPAPDDPLLPVRLRAGGRTIGGAMSWDDPKTLAPFGEKSPFFGLSVPGDVTVTAQVMAEPDPALADRTIATLADGTPLVTRREEGQGQVVLVHVTANADWSSLPLSGLFVQMLDRLAISTRPAAPVAEELQGTVWTAERVLDGFGALQEAEGLAGVPGPALAEGRTGPQMPPGLYAAGDRRLAVNAVARDRVLAPVAWPATVTVEGVEIARETALKGWLLAGALALLAADVLAALWLSGRMRGPRAGVAGVAAALAAGLLLAAPEGARAQEAVDEQLLRAASGVVLAHVLTGDAAVDRMAAAGLSGLSSVLAARTSVEPDAPMGVSLEEDELSVFTLLYWPVTLTQPAPSPQAYAKLNRYLRSGGMILFDTRDADVAGLGGATPEARRLQALAAPLDIPPLEPVPQDHVLTRTFYLLQDFPGRHAGRAVWVEAAPPDAARGEGMPFRNLNDGVTPVVIGGNDWAAAWAVDERGTALAPVGRGFAGERQREIAFRFGVNLVMHVLTGNYKSDQVHVPALLERLGQ